MQKKRSVNGINWHSYVIINFSGPKLKDSMIWNLAQRISTKKKLNTLALNGLELEGYVIETHVTNQRDINEAAYKALRQWRLQYENARVAHSRLCHILKGIRMAELLAVLKA